MDFFKNRTVRQIAISFMVIRVSLLLYGCANMARPGGGPIDEAPPTYVKSTPAPFTTNFKGSEIEIVFDENIKIDKASEKVVVSPPQIEMPIVSSNARTVKVKLNDTLIANTTYTIDFSDAIQDNNESNPLENFSFSFSTGDKIDSLIIGGTVLAAENLEPVTGMYVGIQSDLQDSAFTTKPFTRVTKTDSYGNFKILNIAPGSYRIFALKDANSNYFFDMPSEDIAFLDTIIVPEMTTESHRDTVFAESGKIDTIMVHDHMSYAPNDIILYSFNENKKTQYFEKSERLQNNKVTLYFGAPADTLPTLEGLNFDIEDWAIIEAVPTNDTISYWIKDSLIFNLDTLKITSTYLATDTLLQLSPRTDTLSISMRKPRESKTEKKKDKEESDSTVVKTKFLDFKDSFGMGLDIGVNPVITFSEPIEDFDPSMLKLEVKKDSVYQLQPFIFRPVDGKVRDYELVAQLRPGEEYLFTADSTAFNGIYGLFTNKIEKGFKIKTVDQYSNLLFNIVNAPDSSFVELLNSSDAVVRKARVIDGAAKFIHVAPGEYYARIVIDENKNFLFDTGDYSVNRQPEQVYYYTDKIELRANWDVQQQWDVLGKSVLKQKPLEITKNKPKEKKNKNGETNADSKPSGGGGLF